MEAGVGSIRAHPSTSSRGLSDPGDGVKGEDLSRTRWTTLNRLRTGVGRYRKVGTGGQCSVGPQNVKS